MIIFDYSFRKHIGGGAWIGLKHAVHSIQFLKKIFQAVLRSILHQRISVILIWCFMLVCSVVKNI